MSLLSHFGDRLTVIKVLSPLTFANGDNNTLYYPNDQVNPITATGMAVPTSS